MLQPDTGDYLMWHYGNGKMVCYLFLLKCIIGFVNGSPLNSQFNTRADLFSTVLNVKSTLTYRILNKSFIGLFRNMEFLKEDFGCDDCGETPASIVADL